MASNAPEHRAENDLVAARTFGRDISNHASTPRRPGPVSDEKMQEGRELKKLNSSLFLKGKALRDHGLSVFHLGFGGLKIPFGSF